MRIHIESQSNPSNSQQLIDSLLKSVTSLTLPIDVIDTAITSVKASIVDVSASIGESACTLMENIDNVPAVSSSLSKQHSNYQQLSCLVKCLTALTQYREAAVSAGAKQS